MSLLSSLFVQKRPSYSDKVWMTQRAALKGMMTDGLQALTQSEVPIVVSWFADKRQEVVDFVTANQVPYRIVDADTSSVANQDGSVLLLDAQWLNKYSQAPEFLRKQYATSRVHFLFYGHYPIPARESQLVEKISAADKATIITFFSSLDDRAFQMFGAENIKSLMEKMGLKEDEAVEHAMVSKAMERAREKIAGTISTEIITSTETGWYQQNYKQK